MKHFWIIFTNILFLNCLPLWMSAQTGPGGVGNSSNNKLWLRADSGIVFNFQNQTGTVAINSGSTTITGTSTNFTSADIGKRIRIITSAGNKDRIIIAVNSTTSITVNSALDYTQSGCSYAYGFVSQWNDLSGNANNASQATAGNQPLLFYNALNSRPIVYFDGTNDFMTTSSTNWGTNFSIFVVATPRAALDAHNRILETAYNAHFYLGSGNSDNPDCYKFIVNNGSANGAKAGTLVNGQSDIISAIYNGSNDILIENEGTPSTYAQSAPTSSNYALTIAKYFASASNYFKGDLPEIIIYNYALNSAQRIIVSNYLSTKYGIAISNDKYSFDATHPHDLAGIGKETSGENNSATSAGILNISTPSSFDVGDYLLFGHDNGSISQWTSAESHNATDLRIAREWRINKTNDPGNVTIRFDVSSLPSNYSNEYYLLIDSDGDFTSGAVAYAMTEVGNNIFEKTNVTLNDGDYITIAARPCNNIPGFITAVDTLIYSGETLNLTVSNYTSGATLQWQQSSGGAYTDISGATSPSYTTPPLTSGNTYFFRCKVTYGGCSVYTQPIAPIFKSCLTCAEIGGTGDLNTTCTIATSTTIPDNKYIKGTGNLVIPTGKTLSCNQGNRFTIDLGGNVDIQGTGSISGNVIILCNNINVAGTINANTKGYLTEQGPGAGVSTDADYGAGGAAYGGNGGSSNVVNGGIAYGSIVSPASFGSGGGKYSTFAGGTGGGQIKIVAQGSCSVSGSITSNGGDGTATTNRGAGGGSGGSVWIQCSTFSGTGTISANGGAGAFSGTYRGGGGGGGRISITCNTSSFTGTISAKGGIGFNNKYSAPGTIYRKTGSNAVLTIDAENQATEKFTPVNISESISLYDFSVKNKAIAELFGTQQNITISNSLNSSGNGVILFRNNVSAFSCNSLSLTDSLCIYNSGATSFNCNNLTTSGQVKFYSSQLNLNLTGDLIIQSGGALTGVGYEKKLNLSCANLNINNNGKITLTGNGYGPGSGISPGTASNSSVHGSGGGGNGGVGGYGGNDGTRFAAGGTSYGLLGDSLINPFYFGSGGGNNNSNALKGGAGGGAVKINCTGTLTIDGILEANGSNGTYSGTYVSGGGAGGCIDINTSVITGNGNITAKGGTADNDPANGRQRGGSGAGGRIALKYQSSSFSGNIIYSGGGKSPNATISDYWEIYNAGGAGTLYLKKGTANGNLYVNNNNIRHPIMVNPLENYMPEDNITFLKIAATNTFDTIFVINEGNLKFTGTSQNTQINVLKSYNNGRVIFDSNISALSITNIFCDDSLFLQNTGNTTINCNSFESSNEINSYCSKFTLKANGTVRLKTGSVLKGIGKEKSLLIESQNLNIETGASIQFSGNGYGSDSGPGAGTGNPTGSCYGAGGAGYGGAGGYGNGTEPCPGNEPGSTYGSESMPTDFGSGGGSYTGAKALWEGGYGGGAIKIICTNDVTINGSILANGQNGMNGAVNRGPGGGAGGSVWIQAQSLNGTGLISANGGNGGKDNGGNYRGGGGGGGRVAICGVTTDNFYNSGSGTGTITVNGGIGNYNPPPSGTGANGTIYANTSGEACKDIVLPTELTSFRGYCNNQTVTLVWTTLSESNNDYFSVEKSSDGINWVNAGNVDGAGNSNTAITYSWTDTENANGFIYYRLKQVDFDGSAKVYDPISVYCSDNDIEIIHLYPIPAGKSINLQLYSSVSDNVYVYMQNMLGQTVYSEYFQIQNGLTNLVLDLKGLASSTYYVRAQTSSGNISNLKLVLISKN